MAMQLQAQKGAASDGHGPAASAGHETVFVDQFTDGILDPDSTDAGAGA